MLELNGKYNNAIIKTNNVEDKAIGQVISLLNEPISKGATVIVMPDICVSKGTVTGLSMKYDKLDILCPSIIGTDISCGVMIRQIDISNFDKKTFKKLDRFIYSDIPTGAEIHKLENKYTEKLIENLTIDLDKTSRSKILRSLGTLGSGNHFIEVGKHENNYYISVHTGSRFLGNVVHDEHLKIAYQNFKQSNAVSKNFAYLEGFNKDNYIEDVIISSLFAHENRKKILDDICYYMKWNVLDEFDSVHNYIDFDHNIVRKGSISARENERQIIPLNRADGLLLVTGKGNNDWNNTAPHGSGRKYSRSKSKDKVDMTRYERSMKGIYSSTVTKSNIDEAPEVYKNTNMIMEQIKETVSIDKIVKPVYSMKTNKNVGKIK